MSKVKQCSCISQVNKQLEEYNTRLDCVPTINLTTGKFDTGLRIATTKIDSKVRKSMKTVLAAFCPFCGKVL